VLRELIQAVRALTGRPFGVNCIVESTSFGPLTTAEHIAVLLEEKVRVVTFFWAWPPREWIGQLKKSGCDVWFQTSSVEAARTAVAVCVGTRLIATPEANAHVEYKRRVVAAGHGDVARTCIFGPEWPDAPMRVLRNRVVREWEGRDAQTPPPSDPPQIIGRTQLGPQGYAMPKFSAILPMPETSGDFDEMCLAAGESAPLTKEITSAGEVVTSMCREAAEILA
jgi:NAD(P)H-dependent flavin oxidoreductase YrpB (nitropropane dioxygenase family)